MNTAHLKVLEGGKSASRRFVLIVDDDVAQCEEIADFFQNRGISTEICTDPAEAVAIIEKQHPALVILDIKMPGMNGVRVSQVVRFLNYRGAILLMSGDLEAIRSANIEHPDVFAVIDKPVPLPLLERYARAVIDNAG